MFFSADGLLSGGLQARAVSKRSPAARASLAIVELRTEPK
jgi:hypothetical protein